MSENQETTGVRERVVDRAKVKLKSEWDELSDEFMDDFGQLLSGTNVPKADAFLALFEKQVGGSA